MMSTLLFSLLLEIKCLFYLSLFYYLILVKKIKMLLSYVHSQLIISAVKLNLLL